MGVNPCLTSLEVRFKKVFFDQVFSEIPDSDILLLDMSNAHLRFLSIYAQPSYFCIFLEPGKAWDKLDAMMALQYRSFFTKPLKKKIIYKIVNGGSYRNPTDSIPYRQCVSDTASCKLRSCFHDSWARSPQRIANTRGCWQCGPP